MAVNGHAELLEDDDVISHIDERLARPWAPAERADHVRVVADTVTGRAVMSRRI